MSEAKLSSSKGSPGCAGHTGMTDKVGEIAPWNCCHASEWLCQDKTAGVGGGGLRGNGDTRTSLFSLEINHP